MLQAFCKIWFESHLSIFLIIEKILQGNIWPRIPYIKSRLLETTSLFWTDRYKLWNKHLLPFLYIFEFLTHLPFMRKVVILSCSNIFVFMKFFFWFKYKLVMSEFRLTCDSVKFPITAVVMEAGCCSTGGSQPVRAQHNQHAVF